MNNEVSEVLEQLKQLGSEQTKKTYLRHGAKEPLYGVTSGSMKPLARKYKKNTALAKSLYASGNYDAMYFAGMITDPKTMTKEDFEDWMQGAYCSMIGEYIVSVTLAETAFAQELADAWIKSKNPIYESAGWSCYAWLIGHQKDEIFAETKIATYLHDIEPLIHRQEDRVRYAMNNFVISVGISYLPLHEEAYALAQRIGQVEVDHGDTNCKTPNAVAYIEKAKNQNRLGFKRRNVRC